MARIGPFGRVLLLPAWFAVVVVDVVLPRVRTAGRWEPLARIHRWIGRLPAMVALPLFLVPELCSRGGWVVSAWMLLNGQGWRALAVYAATKLLAGSLALWIYTASLPALLRVRAFAAVHASMVSWHGWLAAHLRPRTGKFSALMAELRQSRVKARSSAATPATARSSEPAGPSPTE